jgi:hypothetical protein
MSEYSFETVWRVEAPIEAVWANILDSESWPEWWKGVEQALKLKPGDQNGVGAIWRYTFKSRLPYKLTFETRVLKIEPPFIIEGQAFGELDGLGVWTLSEEGPVTLVRYNWDVKTTRLWMNLLSPIARPLFAWNHNYIMNMAAKGLAGRLDTRLVGEVKHLQQRPGNKI